MARRRFVWSKERQELVEVGQDYTSVPRTNTDAALWGDRGYEGLRATDGTDISSRTKHREYMRANGLATIDDYTETWKKSEQRKAEYLSTGKGGAVRAEDVARAIHDLERKKR